ncbi:MAG: hypothetical protein IJ785_01745 [Bacteroidales bacterium]|nr:hypothetical protein [Bacteroidales bacterium]
MDKNSFGKMMSHPGTLSPDEWEELHRERERYPYCAPLQVVSLLADKAAGAPLWEKQTLPVVTLYMQDADRLDEQMEALARAAARPEPAEARPVVESAAAPSAPKVRQPDADFDILQEINAYQDVSFKTAPKSVILSNFLEKDGGIVPDFESFDSVSVQELAKNSIRPTASFESETLAVILEKQGKFQQALEMYEKLLVKNPEKSSTFAVRIAELKKHSNE